MAMKPMCRLCGIAHWGNERHVFAAARRVIEELAPPIDWASMDTPGLTGIVHDGHDRMIGTPATTRAKEGPQIQGQAEVSASSTPTTPPAPQRPARISSHTAPHTTKIPSPVTKPPRNVTKSLRSVTKVGRPRIWPDNRSRQRAYRERLKAGLVKSTVYMDTGTVALIHG